MRYGYVNSALTSKINWTAGIAGVIGLLSAFDVIPPENQAAFNEITLLVVGTFIPTFRTFFTVKPSAK